MATIEAGAQLLQQTAPLFDGITQEVAMLSAFRDHPAGTVRINSSEYAASADLPEAARMAAALPPHQNRGAHQQSLGGYCRPTFRYGCALIDTAIND